MELRYYQSDLLAEVENQWSLGHKNVAVMAPTGSGKCMGRGTPILMFDGTIKAVEDVVEGDQLMGPDSTQRNVLGTCRGAEMLYRVTPVKGDSYVVNESHILSLKQTRRKISPRSKCDEYSEEPVAITPLEYLSKSATWRHYHKGWRTGVDFRKSALPDNLEPYMLGLWLGDGHTNKAAITSMDPEIISYVYEYWTAHGVGVGIKDLGPENQAVEIYATSGKGLGKPSGRNPILNMFKAFDLFGNKHIPHVYLTGDRRQRLELLAGLMDSDGHLSKGYFDYVSKLPDLANQVAYLARSLGMAAYVKECQKSSQHGTVGTYYRVTISGEVSEIPCKLPRKQAEPRKQKKSVLVTGINVEPIGVGDYFGFEIDGDHLYLLGDFTVTHNTVVIAEAVRRHPGASCAIAHRDNLVIQLAMALAEQGVRHRVIASQKTQRAAAALQAKKLGKVWIDPGAKCAVASAQTLSKRTELTKWAGAVTLWVTDEGHHLTRGSVWGRCVDLFTHPECKGLIPSATMGRADGKGLGSHHDGYADVLVALVEDGDKLTVRTALPHESITCAPAKVLMDQGYLSRYKVAIAKTHLENYLGAVGPSGDWTQADLKKAAANTDMVGDVVESYKQFANESTAIVFARDVEEAGNIAKAYRAEGISAEVLTGETDPSVRMSIFSRLETGKLKIVVAVDVISEGTDIPSVAAIIFARATASLGLYLQMVGRGLRTSPGKQFAIIIDHVGNVLRHRGGPDTPRTWSLSRRDKRAPAVRDAIPLRVCLNIDCMQPYEKHLDACPHCGQPAPEPERRGPPEAVDGVLALMDDETMARLRGEMPATVEDYSREMYASGLPGRFAGANVKRHKERLDALELLRDAMAVWAGPYHEAGESDTEIQRRWWLTYGIDIWSAQNLSREDAVKLLDRLVTGS